MSTTTTKKEAVLAALLNNGRTHTLGRGLTAAQIEARYNVGNARATISDLRNDGYAIYANQHTDTKGRTKTFYRVGRPNRAMVRAAFAAKAAGLVTEDLV